MLLFSHTDSCDQRWSLTECHRRDTRFAGGLQARREACDPPATLPGERIAPEIGTRGYKVNAFESCLCAADSHMTLQWR